MTVVDADRLNAGRQFASSAAHLLGVPANRVGVVSIARAPPPAALRQVVVVLRLAAVDPDLVRARFQHKPVKIGGALVDSYAVQLPTPTVAEGQTSAERQVPPPAVAAAAAQATPPAVHALGV